MSIWIREGPVGICARCQRKMLLAKLSPDPNAPGLMVCDEDRDLFDPYRLPARKPENITLQRPRPDVQLAAPTSPGLDEILESEFST